MGRRPAIFLISILFCRLYWVWTPLHNRILQKFFLAQKRKWKNKWLLTLCQHCPGFFKKLFGERDASKCSRWVSKYICRGILWNRRGWRNKRRKEKIQRRKCSRTEDWIFKNWRLNSGIHILSRAFLNWSRFEETDTYLIEIQYSFPHLRFSGRIRVGI